MPPTPVRQHQAISRGINRKLGSGSNNSPNKRSTDKRPKSANISSATRFLIATCALIWVKSDQRERDVDGELKSQQSEGKRHQSPISDMPQTLIAKLYFGIHRTVIAQTMWGHLYALPNFGILNPYLFPFIRSNPNISRRQIRHVAYRIWEYLVHANRVGVIKYTGDEAKNMVPLGGVCGWWLESESDKPRGYQAWYDRDQGDLPTDYHEVLERAMKLPWPEEINILPTGLEIKPVKPVLFLLPLPKHAKVEQGQEYDAIEPSTPQFHAPALNTRVVGGPLPRSGCSSTARLVAGLQFDAPETAFDPQSMPCIPRVFAPLQQRLSKIIGYFALIEVMGAPSAPTDGVQTSEVSNGHYTLEDRSARAATEPIVDQFPIIPVEPHETVSNNFNPAVHDRSYYWLPTDLDAQNTAWRLPKGTVAETSLSSSGSANTGIDSWETVDPNLLQQRTNDPAPQGFPLASTGRLDPSAPGQLLRPAETYDCEALAFEDIVNLAKFVE